MWAVIFRKKSIVGHKTKIHWKEVRRDHKRKVKILGGYSIELLF